MSRVLSTLGVLLLVLLAGAGTTVALLPAGRLKATADALRGVGPAAPSAASDLAVSSALAAEPAEVGLLQEARERLLAAKEDFQQEKAMAEAQLKAERGEIEILKAAVEARLEEASRVRPASGTPAAPPAPGEGDGKGIKALAEISARMSPKSVVELLQDESEAGVARILRRMEPKQAGKVMAEMVAADPDRARKVVSFMKEVPKAK